MSPVPKKFRLEKSDDSPMASDNDPNSGVIRFEVDKVSTLIEISRFSPIVEVGGLPWKVKVAKEKESHLSAFLYGISHATTQWKIDVIAEFILVNVDISKNYSRPMDKVTYNHVNPAWGFRHIALDGMMDEEKGFIKNDKITVEVRFSIVNIKGIWVEKHADFSSGNNCSDIALVMKENLIRVNKKSLFPSTARWNEKKGNCSSGFISFEIRVPDIGIYTIRSPEVEVLGMRWNVGVKKRMSSSYLEVYFFCLDENESNIWSIDVSRNIILIGEVNRTWKSTMTFNHENTNWGTNEFILWDDLINEEKGFVKDGKITIEARFTLSKIVGIRTIPLIDFDDPEDPRHDVALLIEGQKVYVGKQILAFHSPVFNAMFYGNHIEKNKKEIELKEVDRKVFIEMLNLIYPSYQKINEENAEPLQKMADYFQIKMVIDQVEQFFIDSTKLNTAAKLKLSDQYRLVKLQDHCFDSFTSANDIMDLDATELSDKAKSALFDKAKKLR